MPADGDGHCPGHAGHSVSGTAQVPLDSCPPGHTWDLVQPLSTSSPRPFSDRKISNPSVPNLSLMPTVGECTRIWFITAQNTQTTQIHCRILIKLVSKLQHAPAMLQ